MPHRQQLADASATIAHYREERAALQARIVMLEHLLDGYRALVTLDRVRARLLPGTESTPGVHIDASWFAEREALEQRVRTLLAGENK